MYNIDPREAQAGAFFLVAAVLYVRIQLYDVDFSMFSMKQNQNREIARKISCDGVNWT